LTTPALAVVMAVVLAALLAACTSGGAGPLAWRDLDLELPPGWMVLDQRDDLLLIANRDLRADDIEANPSLPQDPDATDAVAVQFTTDSTGADAWRSLVESEGGEIERDERIQIDGLPATSLTFNWVTNGVPTREQVVIVPSRQLVLVLQPVPVQGQMTGPDVYLRHVDEFIAILESLDFGAPADA
jgi:hypothetical protein